LERNELAKWTLRPKSKTESGATLMSGRPLKATPSWHCAPLSRASQRHKTELPRRAWWIAKPSHLDTLSVTRQSVVKNGAAGHLKKAYNWVARFRLMAHDIGLLRDV
jgi:hypothetical protein